MTPDAAPYIVRGLWNEWRRIDRTITNLTIHHGYMGREAMAWRGMRLSALYRQLRAINAEIDKWGALVYGDQPIALLPAGPRIIHMEVQEYKKVA